jgi:uncharacterized protein YndB with AHSA1/START domain
MTIGRTPSPDAARIERTYDAPAELIWELWTTAAGLEEWFAPDGFESRVSELELRPGGQLRYTMTATAPEQVAFLRDTGNQLSTEVCKTFTEVAPLGRLAYLSLIDFVPGHQPYEHLTTVDIEAAGDRTTVVLTIDPLHDETWSQQHRAHRGEELANLGGAVRRRAGADYQTTIRVKSSPEALFDALTTVPALAAWWSPCTGSGDAGGELRFSMNSAEPLVIHVDEATRPASVRWTVTDCPFLPDWVGTRPAFTITAVGDGESELRFRHHGLTAGLDCIEMCTRSWDHYIATSLREYAESGGGRTFGSDADKAWRAGR